MSKYSVTLYHAAIRAYFDEAMRELMELEKQRQEEWWHNEDQDPRWIEGMTNEGR